MKRGTKYFVKGYEGDTCGPFRWTDICGWVAAGNLTPEDEVRLPEATEWSRIGSIPELLSPPPSDEFNPGLTVFRPPAREPKPVGARAAAYLKVLGCPIPRQRLNPATAVQWIRVLEELNPQRADATEHWAAEEESKGRVPAGSPHDATPEQLETLRTRGRTVPGDLTRREAQRMISGPPTEGQLRRLQFYRLTLPAGAGKDEAAELIDSYMRENWDSEQAYQAFKKTSAAEALGDRKPAPVLRLRPSTEPDFVELNSIGAAPIPVPQAPSMVRTGDRQGGFRPIQTHIMLFCLIGLGLAVVVAAFVRRKPGPDLSPPPSGASGAPGQGGSQTEAKRIPKVILLESPDRARAEQLRIFVSSLPVTGVMGGPEPRTMIEGRMYRVGDVVDESRRIVVLQIDMNTQSVAFGDAAGNIARRVIE